MLKTIKKVFSPELLYPHHFSIRSDALESDTDIDVSDTYLINILETAEAAYSDMLFFMSYIIQILEVLVQQCL